MNHICTNTHNAGNKKITKLLGDRKVIVIGYSAVTAIDLWLQNKVILVIVVTELKFSPIQAFTQWKSLNITVLVKPAKINVFNNNGSNDCNVTGFAESDEPIDN